MKKNNSRIVINSKLNANHFEALVADEALAIIIPNYYQSEDCKMLSSRILASDKIEQYTHEQIEAGAIIQKYYGVDRIGVPFNLTYGYSPNSAQKKHYYDTVSASFDTMKWLAAPALSPTEQLRKELELDLQIDAEVASFEGAPMLAGITRITRAETSYLSADQPHFDALPVEYGDLDAQLAANIYLKVPGEGGYLEIWDIPPLDPLFEPPNDWRSQLTESIKMKPNEGDLIIFNCRKPHAIGAFEGEPRISAQMFMGYQRGKPLQLWN